MATKILSHVFLSFVFCIFLLFPPHLVWSQSISGPEGEFKCSLKTRDTKFDYTYLSTLNVKIVKGVVKEFSSIQSAASPGDEHSCTIDLSSLKQVASNEGILLTTGSKAGQEGECDILISKSSNEMLVRFKNCKSTKEDIFCSPRHFWSDVAMNISTQKCRYPDKEN